MRRAEHKLSYPLEQGVVTNWVDMEKIWHHAFFSELKVDPKEHNVLLTEPPLNPKANRERIAQLMFDTFHVRGLYVSTDAVLSLYSSGRTTGCVVDSGVGVTSVVPICEGCALPHATTRLSVGGHDLTRYLLKLLLIEAGGAENGVGLMKLDETEPNLFCDMKEELCYFALDFEMTKDAEFQAPTVAKTYVGKSGDCNISVALTPRFQCPEALFQPKLLDGQGGEGAVRRQGIHESVFDSIKNCDQEIQQDLFKNIVLSGGTTLLSGFVDRLEKELIGLTPPTTEVKVVAPPERRDSPWIGGSVLASTSWNKPDRWISEAEYAKSGPSVIHRNCT
mmetsp:Transcript_55319/g.111051  ORF Transcript_55319/g.111051 Transcript_55319/m.111051 type:complete len:335 (-) Transcript_55319:280-1284(-)